MDATVDLALPASRLSGSGAGVVVGDHRAAGTAASSDATRDASQALAFVSTLMNPGVFVFLDVKPALSQPLVVRQIKDIARPPDPNRP